MSCRIIKTFIVLILSCSAVAIPAFGQFGINWTGLVTEIIDEGARSDVQKVFQSLSTINFSNSKLNAYRKEAGKMGLRNPTTVEALMCFEQGIRPLEVSPFSVLSNQKISSIGDGVFRNIGNNVTESLRLELENNELSDYLSESTLKELNLIDTDGSLGMRLKESMSPQFALLLNNRPECLLTLKQHPALLKFDFLPLLPYFTYKATHHSDRFKKGAVPNISDWDFSIQNNDVLLISSQSGEIGRVRRNIDSKQASLKEGTDSNSLNDLRWLSQINLDSSHSNLDHSGTTKKAYLTPSKGMLLIDVSADPQLLNCYLPLSSQINFGSSSLITDEIGRVVEVDFILQKAKYKYNKNRQLKSKDILKAKGEAGRKAFMVIPKNYGGTETWNNVMAYSDTKENKQNLKALYKRLSELSKTGGKSISVKISYNSTSDSPSTIQYYDGEELICTLK